MEMDAPPEHVFELAREVSAWAALLPHYRRSAVVARRNERALAQFVAMRPLGRIGIPVTWRAVCWSDGADRDDLRLHFAHTRGVTRGMRVTWHIRPLPGDEPRSEVTIQHEFSRRLPVVGPEVLPRLVDQFFTKPIATRTLRRFKELAEAAETRLVHPETAVSTNLTT
jgi:ribosome-associated toxin RatA of RatAB toxin-antitoxin module